MPLPDVFTQPRIPREPLRLFGRSCRHVLGTLLGLFLGPAMLVTAAIARWGHRERPFLRMRQWEVGRLHRFHRIRIEGPSALSSGRSMLLGALTGLFGIVMLDLVIWLFVLTFGSLAQMFIGGPVVFGFAVWSYSRPAAVVLLLYGPATAIATAGVAEAATWLLVRLLRRWTPVTREDALESDIGRLLTTRRGVVLAIDDERRRIERDLHDGVQQNVVSLSMLLARARRSRDPQKTAALLDQAHERSQQLIDEMRQVAWRIYPTALDEHGLRAALDVIAETSPLPIEIAYGPGERPPQAVESAAYFVAREAVTNVLKHAGATRIRIELFRQDAVGRPRLYLSVTDDGRGGADAEGGGLQGLARRVAALDGTVNVDSPPGGPTVITAEIPCD